MFCYSQSHICLLWQKLPVYYKTIFESQYLLALQTSQLYFDWWLYKHVFYSLISITIKVLTMRIICVRISAITASVSLMFSKIFDNASFPIHDSFFFYPGSKQNRSNCCPNRRVNPSVRPPSAPDPPFPHGQSLN